MYLEEVDGDDVGDDEDPKDGLPHEELGAGVKVFQDLHRVPGTTRGKGITSSTSTCETCSDTGIQMRRR